MRVLLDENLPHDLLEPLSKHDVSTVQGGHIDAFVTMDRKLQHESKLSVLPFGVVLIGARSNRVQDLLPLVAAILAALAGIQAGRLGQVGA